MLIDIMFVYQNPNRLVYVMEYMASGSLADLIKNNVKRKRHFCEIDTVLYMKEIICIVEYLHKQGVILGQLAPDHILLEDDGHIKLNHLDLGIERIEEKSDFVGKMAYNTTPETLKGEEHTMASDWYLVGVLIYELLAGAVPYFKGSKTEFYQNMQEGELVFPENFSDVSKDILTKLLMRDPSKRLGCDEVKSHEFFTHVAWPRVVEKNHRMPPVTANTVFQHKPNEAINFERVLKVSS